MKFTTKTFGILLICTLVVAVAVLTVTLFRKNSIPTLTGDMALKSSLFGMTIHKGNAQASKTEVPE